MNINPTNLIINNNTAFGGKIIIKGKAEDEVIKTIYKSEQLKTLLKGYDVVIRTRRCNAGFFNKHHPYLTKMYKLTFSRYEENSLKNRILDFFNKIPRLALTEGFHSKAGTVQSLKDFHIDNLVKRLKKISED